MKNNLIPWSDIIIDDNRAAIPGEDARLTASIRENGLICRISLCALPDGKYRVCAGRRRAKALRYLYPDGLRPEWFDLTEAPEVVSYEENANRQPLTLREDVAQIRALAAMPGMNVQRLAAKLGRSPRAIARRLAVAELPDKFLDLADKGAPLAALERLAVLPEAQREKASTWEILNNHFRPGVFPLPERGWCADCAACPHNTAERTGDLFEPDEIGCLDRDCCKEHFANAWREALDQARADGVPVCWASEHHRPYMFDFSEDIPFENFDDMIEGGWEPGEDGDAPAIVEREFLVVTDIDFRRQVLHFALDRIDPDEIEAPAKETAEAEDPEDRREIELAGEIESLEQKLKVKRNEWIKKTIEEAYPTADHLATLAGGWNGLTAILAARAWYSLFSVWRYQLYNFAHLSREEWDEKGMNDPHNCGEYIVMLFRHDLKEEPPEKVEELWKVDFKLAELKKKAATAVPASKKLTALRAELKKLKEAAGSTRGRMVGGRPSASRASDAEEQ